MGVEKSGTINPHTNMYYGHNRRKRKQIKPKADRGEMVGEFHNARFRAYYLYVLGGVLILV